jgi:ABC-type sugar transport system substrate-binding protein
MIGRKRRFRMAGKKKALVVALVLLVVAAFGVSAQAKLKAAFIISNMANESQAFSSKMFLKYGAEYGFDMYTFDAKGDTQAESQIVTNCIAQKFKVFSSTRTTSTRSSPAS